MPGSKREAASGRGQGGFILLAVLVATTLGMLLLLPLMGFIRNAVVANQSLRDRASAALANEAAILRVVADLSRGADALPTTYSCQEPHAGSGSFQTLTITTSYAIPQVTVNNLSPTVTIAAPSVAPPPTQQYVDPGLSDPRFASLPAGWAYLMRILVGRAGTLQVNWAYSPAGTSRVAVWNGCPVDPSTGTFYTPGLIERFPTDTPVLDTGNSPANATSVRTGAVTVAAGIYTIVFDNTRGNDTKTTAPFAATGGPTDTWVYVTAGRDYVITATTGNFPTKVLVRQVPGYTEPPGGGWSTTNPSFVPSQVYIYTWQEQQGLPAAP